MNQLSFTSPVHPCHFWLHQDNSILTGEWGIWTNVMRLVGLIAIQSDFGLAHRIKLKTKSAIREYIKVCENLQKRLISHRPLTDVVYLFINALFWKRLQKSNFGSNTCQVVSYRKWKTKEYFKLWAANVVAVTYERYQTQWLWHFGKLVSEKRWSQLEVRLLLIFNITC